MKRRPASLTLIVLSLLSLLAWYGTLALPADAPLASLRWAIALVLLPTLIGYGLFVLQDLQWLRVELNTLSRYASWLVLGVAGLIVVSELGFLNPQDGLSNLKKGSLTLLLSLLFWGGVLAFFFLRTQRRMRSGGEAILALLYFVVMAVHNFPEGLALGMSLPQTQDPTLDSGVLAALAIQNVVDAAIAGAVLLTRQIHWGLKVVYLVGLPIMELASATLVLREWLLLDTLAEGVLIFAAAGMLSIALSDIVMRYFQLEPTAVERSS